MPDHTILDITLVGHGANAMVMARRPPDRRAINSRRDGVDQALSGG
jgi:hypothetical protein